jgi:hypothetical protein
MILDDFRDSMNTGMTRDKGLHSIYLSMHLICNAGMPLGLFCCFCCFVFFLPCDLFCTDVMMMFILQGMFGVHGQLNSYTSAMPNKNSNKESSPRPMLCNIDEGTNLADFRSH